MGDIGIEDSRYREGHGDIGKDVILSVQQMAQGNIFNNANSLVPYAL